MNLQERIIHLNNAPYKGNEEECSGRVDGIFEASDEAAKIDRVIAFALDALKEADNGLIYWEPIVGHGNKARITNKVKLAIIELEKWLPDNGLEDWLERNG